MVGSSITLAQSSDYKSTWDGQYPTDFGIDLVLLTGKFGTISAKHAEALAATGGGADAKAATESTLETSAFTLTRALAVHFKKSGDLDRRGKVDFSKTDLVKLRDRDLVDQSTAIRDLATAALSEAGAAGRGVTATLLEDLRDLDDLVLQFADSESGPRFIQAWKQARIIVDAGHRPGEEEAPASPPPVPPAP
jgi:hypothetical protein